MTAIVAAVDAAAGPRRRACFAVWTASLVAGLSVLSGCSSSDSASEMSGVTTATVQATSVTSEPPADMHVRELNDAVLVGPHYTLGIAWVATGRELDAQDAARLGIQPVRAAKGQELLIAGVAPQETTAAFKPTYSIPVAAAVDGTSTLLGGLPLTDSNGGFADTTKLIMISAPSHASVQLQVTDAGQEQDMNLRTGATSGHGYQQQDSNAAWQGQSRVTLPFPGTSRATTSTLSANNPLPTTSDATDHATLTNYQGGKWAPSGMAFLTVTLPNVRGFSGAGLFYSVNIEDPTAFTFAPASGGGKPIPAEPGRNRIWLGSPDLFSDATVVFQVPTTTTGGTVTFDMAKGQLVLTDGGGGASWIKPPNPFTLKLTFTR